MALASKAALAALDGYIERGGRSRGARVVCEIEGGGLPQARSGPIADFRFRSGRAQHRSEQVVVGQPSNVPEVSFQPVRRFDDEARSFFERDWTD